MYRGHFLRCLRNRTTLGALPMRHVQIIAEAYRIAMNKQIESQKPFTDEEFQSIKQMYKYLKAVDALPRLAVQLALLSGENQ